MSSAPYHVFCSHQGLEYMAVSSPVNLKARPAIQRQLGKYSQTLAFFT